MESLPTFIIKLWDKPEQVYSVVAWKEAERRILLLDAAGFRKILKLHLPKLDQTGWHYVGNPFPDDQPLRMEEIRLLCPPCRGNAQESAKINAPGSSACEWEKTWVQGGGEVLWPTPDDASPLRSLKDQIVARMRKEYEARKQKLAALTVGEFRRLQITNQVFGPYAIFPANADTLRRYVWEESFHLDFEIKQPLSDDWIGDEGANFPTSRLCIQKEYSDLACSYLRENWARKHGLDLTTMEQDRLRFMEFVRKHATNVMENVPPAFEWQDLFTGKKRESTALRHALQITRQQEWVLCALVRHVLIYPDGGRAWLARSELRPPNHSEEREFDDYLGVGEATRLEAVVPKIAAEREKLEVVPVELAGRTEDLRKTLGKLPEVFADPLVAAARDASIKQGVPHEFVWWVLQEWHFGKFPKVKGTLLCGLGPTLKRAGFPFSRPTVGRWLKIIREELEKRGLESKRNHGGGAIKAPNSDVAQAKDPGPLPGDGEEPPEVFVQWVADRDAAGIKPTVEDVLRYVRERADEFGLASYSYEKLKAIAEKWLNEAMEILNEPPSGPVEPDDHSNL